MIFVEARASEIQIANAVRVEGLENWTGADVLISPLSMPCKSRALLTKHLESGAIMAQIKLGEDLAASVGDRMNDALARMHQCSRVPATHWLVFVGTLSYNDEGSALINGHRTHMNVSWATIEGAIVSWLARGGVWYPHIKHESQLSGWAQNMERRLGQYNAQYYKYVLSTPEFPDQVGASTDVLQLPVRVRDGRRALVGFEGLGVERVNRVWDYCGGDFKACLAFLTDPASASKVEGIGAKTIASIRKQCGLGEGDGYIGWGRDVMDVDAIVSDIAKDIEKVLPKRSKAEAAADTDVLWPKHNGAKSKAH